MTTVGIASIPSRKDMLEKVLDSLCHQVDYIYLVLNYGETEPPIYLRKYDNLSWWLADNSRGDAEKFAMAEWTHGYYLTLDDDLVVPRGYVQKMTEGVERYNGLVSLHGRTYLKPVTSFTRWAGNYRCLGRVSDDVKVNLIGSGCCAFHTDRLDVTMSDFKLPNMADLWLSKMATEQGVPMVVLAHERDYLTYLNPTETIWRNTKNFSVHTEILKSFIK